ncbi:hypothetical protein F4805DRAFT_458130 [Annulohypoxylon moriforme]|nr:hypothetical protein F4805DRAFT_458130 [Annulohypoxylon moriforme]
MDYWNNDQWMNDVDLEALFSGIDPNIMDPNTTGPAPPVFPETYTNSQPIQGWDPTWTSPYGQQNFGIPEPSLYAPQYQGYSPGFNQWYPTWQGNTVDNLNYDPMSMFPTLDPYTEAFSSSNQAWDNIDLSPHTSLPLNFSPLPEVQEVQEGETIESIPSPPRVPSSPEGEADEEHSNPIDAPLSFLVEYVKHIPVADISAYVSRGVSQRWKEAIRKRQVRIPLNKYGLYCKAYIPFIGKLIDLGVIQNNENIPLRRYVGKIAGLSWNMEPWSIRNRFDRWASTERKQHKKAFFSGKSKSTLRRSKRTTVRRGRKSRRA